MAAGVDRTTVHRWCKEDCGFQAALNGARRDLREAATARLFAVAGQALDTVSAAIKDGDVKSSLAVLRGVGLLSGKPPILGSDEEQDLHRHREWQDALKEVLNFSTGLDLPCTAEASAAH